MTKTEQNNEINQSNEMKYFKMDECKIIISRELYGYNCQIENFERLENIGRIMYLTPSFKKSLDQTLSMMKIPKPTDVNSNIWDKIFVEISINNHYAKYTNNLNFAVSCKYIEGCKTSFRQGGYSMDLDDLRLENFEEKIEEAKNTLEKSIESLVADVRNEEEQLKLKEYYTNFSEECKKRMKN